MDRMFLKERNEARDLREANAILENTTKEIVLKEMKRAKDVKTFKQSCYDNF